jgi:hypothetical protein
MLAGRASYGIGALRVFERSLHKPPVVLPGEVCIVDLFHRDPPYLRHLVCWVRLALDDAGTEPYGEHMCAVRSVGVRRQQDRAFDDFDLDPEFFTNLAHDAVHGMLSDLQEIAGHVHAPLLWLVGPDRGQCFAVPNDRGSQRQRGAAVPGVAAKGAPDAAGGFRLFQSSHIRRAEPVGLGAAKGKLLL